ncbi:MAG: tyrosine-type recombinase/integrase, partial [Acidimicrobiia bacterium]
GRRRWYVVMDVGTDPVTGRRRQKWHGSWATKKEAERALTKILGGVLDGTYVEPDRVTVRGFLIDEWLPAMKTRLRPSTHRLYETLATAYTIPRIGEVRLQRLSPSHLNRLYADLLERGAREGKPLGAETTRKVHRLLHRALRDAVKWGRVARNAAADADPPRAPRPQLRAWEASHLSALLEQTRDDRLSALWQLLATTGLRRAEALGLRWMDIDLDEARLSVRQTLAYVGTKASFSEPKTGSSRRLVTLAPSTVESLRAHKARQAQERLALGPAYASFDLVFAHPDGTALNPATVSRSFDALVKAAELPKLTLHGLRHTFATLALLDGIPSKVVAEILGHSSTRVTEDTYQHVTPGMKADATARVAALLRRSLDAR